MRLRRQLGLVFALALGLAGCARRETPVERGDRTQTFLLGNLSEPNDLDPAYPDSVETFRIVMALMEGLAQYDAKTCLPVPAVAERWEATPDQRTWTFHLRSTARWSNGDPVTAGDFVYAYRRLLSPRLAAEYASMLFALANGEAFYLGKVTDFAQVGAVAADDHTLVLHLSHPVPYLDKLVCHFAWYPIHRATIEKFGRIDDRGTHWTRPGNYVGNGPFVLKAWHPNQIVRVTRSPTYWNRGEIKLQEVDFLPVEDNATEEAMFRNGEMHETDTIPSDRIAVYERDPTLRGFLHKELYYGTYYYRFNVRVPPLNDVRVRQALAWSIDRRLLVERVTKGGQLPAGNLTPPDRAGFTATAAIGFDPDRARRLLAAAGYPGGKNFPHLEVLFNTSENHRQIAEAIQQMWRRELGISVELLHQEGKVWVDTMRQGNYQIARSSWIGDYLDPSTFLDLMMSTDGNNQTGWSNAEYDRLMNESRQTVDQQRRYALFQRCEQILADECPLLPIYFYARDNLSRPELKGWYPNLLEVHTYTGVSLETAGR